MNNINYLAITKSPYKISYAIFQGTQLKSYGEYHLSYNNYEKDLYIKLNRIIKGTSTDVIVSHELNFDKYLKKDIVKLSAFSTVVKLHAQLNDCVYAEFRTYGWEKRLTFNKPTNKNKVDTINFGYDLDLSVEQIDIANAIILGEGVAHNRLQIGGV